MKCRMGFSNCVDDFCVPNCTRMREYIFMVNQEVTFQKFWSNVVSFQTKLLLVQTEKSNDVQKCTQKYK